MAAVDNYTAEANKAVYASGFVNGGKLVCLDALIETRANGEVNDVYRFAKDIDANLIPIDLWLANGALQSATCDIGIYKPEGGAVVDADALDGALSISAASNHTQGLTDVAIADMQKSLAELAGLDPATHAHVDLGIKFTGAAQQGTKIAVKALFLQK